MLMLKKSEGFRTPDDNYWEYVLSISTGRKQISPFILYRDEVVYAIYRVDELLNQAKRNDLILHAWPGQWSTDVFAWRMSELLKMLPKQKHLGSNFYTIKS